MTREYPIKKKEIQSILLNLIDNSDSIKTTFEDLYHFDTYKIQQDREEMKEFFNLLVIITNNHHRNPGFFNKISIIIEFFSKYIKQTFSNYEIFDIFKKSKPLLLILLNKKILLFDEAISNLIVHMETISQFNKNKKYEFHSQFFYPEIKNYISQFSEKKIREQLLLYDSNVFDNFNEKRLIGENESYLCEIIRNDSVEDFIIYVNKKNISLSKTRIKVSIFETNLFLITNKNPTIIEYTAFFGSIQIFQYLLLNNVELTSSLWIYSIHGNNPDMIHILEENKVELKDYKIYLFECIKCHHNDIANYIKNNFINENLEKISINDIYQYSSLYGNVLADNLLKCAFHYFNYEFLPNFFVFNKIYLFYICKYNHLKLFELILNTGDYHLNITLIYNQVN